MGEPVGGDRFGFQGIIQFCRAELNYTKNEIFNDTYPIELLGLIERGRQAQARKNLELAMLLVGTNPYNKEMNVFFDTLKQELKSKFYDGGSGGPDIEGIKRLKQLQESRRKGVK